MRLILFGLKYSGKTYFGRLLSRRLSYDFLETDRLIEKAFYKKYSNKLSCRQIYKELGEELFRTLEREVIHHLKHKKNTIIAVGGGAALDARNMLHLSKIGTLVYLKTPKDILKSRMLAVDDTPAYLSQHRIDHTFDQMYSLRESIYSQIPSIHLDTENKQEEEILMELEKIVKQMSNEQLYPEMYYGE